MQRVLRSTHVRLSASILLAALLLTGLASTQQAEAVDPPTDTVYVARGYGYADALVGSVLAAANNAPIVTVLGPDTGDRIPDETKAELQRLQPVNIVIFGGPVAVSDKVKGDLGAYASGNVTRIAGQSRFATAVEIAKALPEKVANADLLDGLDATDFLGANDKAADSDLLDGRDSTDFADALHDHDDRYYTEKESNDLFVVRRWAAVNADGSLARGSSGVTSATSGNGFSVDFGTDVSACVYVATLGVTTVTAPPMGFVSVAPRQFNNNAVYVETADTAGSNDHLPFHLEVIC